LPSPRTPPPPHPPPGGTPALRVARWNGASWSAFGQGIGVFNYHPMFAIAELPNGDVLASGAFPSVVGAPNQGTGISRWNGSAWVPIEPPTIGDGQALTRLPNGDVVVGGTFTSLAGVAVNRLGRFDGTTWSPLGSGVSGSVNSSVSALATMPNGDVIAGGEFQTAGGVPAQRVARWSGTAWSAMGAGLGGNVTGLLARPNGDVIASGLFVDRLARWDGSLWLGILPATTGATVASMVALPNGDLAVTGSGLFAGSSEFVWRWDGASWSALPGAPAVGVLAVDRSGQLLLGSAQQVSRWNGSAWLAVAPIATQGFALTQLQPLPDGSLLGAFAAGSTPSLVTSEIRRWNGQSWSVDATADGLVSRMALAADDSVLIAGSHQRVGDEVSIGFARRSSSCRATAAAYGQGCNGSGGPATLVATTLPWLGTTFQSRASGMPANGLGIAVLGLSPLAVPLASVLPVAAPGCTLLVSAEVLAAVVPVAGFADIALALPTTPSLVSGVIRQQVVPLELAPGGSLIAATATNGLQLTLGVY
jgi:trimeric autotransporter adhesin